MFELVDGTEISIEDLKKAFPGKTHPWDEDDGQVISFRGYDDMFRPFGFEMIIGKWCGSWQGEIIYLLRKNYRWYFTAVGFGSCSGCDDFQANFGYEVMATDRNYSKIGSFIERYHSNTRGFDSLVELQQYLQLCLTGEDDSNQWWFYDHDAKETIREQILKMVD